MSIKVTPELLNGLRQLSGNETNFVSNSEDKK
jgi:hypothetical protein